MKESNNIVVQIDGNDYSFETPDTVLNKLLELGYDIPHICNQPNLGPLQSCDSCLVNINGKVVRSCSTQIQDRDSIDVSSSSINDLRTEAVQLILHNHELYCTVCENNNGDCALHNAVHDLDITVQKYPFEPKPYDYDDSNPFYAYDPSQCILCGRCVEACQDIQVNETLSIDWSLPRPRVIWDKGVPANESSCVSCGHCVTVCPVNALMEKSMLRKAGYLTNIDRSTRKSMVDAVKSVEHELTMAPVMAISNAESKLRKFQIKKTKTVCVYCGVGCSFEIWTKGRDILKVQPQPESPANGISTCIKGKFGWDFVNSKDRLRNPLIRNGNGFREASWDEAMNTVAKGLLNIKSKYGGDAIEFIASSKGTNEEAYMVQKLARQLFGTNNVDNSSRFCQAPATTGLWRTVGYGGDSGSIQDIYMADLVIAVGTNTAESHPVLATRVKRAHKLNGQKLIVADLRMHEMARRADIFLHPKPGTDIVWLSAVTKYILDQGWEDREFLSERVNGLEEYRRSLEKFTLDFAAETSGIDQETLKSVAEMIHKSKRVCALWAMGVTQHQMGSDTSTAISNLLLVTGNYGRRGTGAYPLRGHNNVQGTSDFGAMSAYLPGYQSIKDTDVREKFEKAWHVKINPNVGYDNNTCLEAMEYGKIKAMYVIGEELVETGSDSAYIREKLSNLEFLVVQDMFLSETAKYADVVLPACASLEKEGTFTNTERRIQRIYKAMDPLGNSRSDFAILKDLANKLGANWSYKSPAEVMEEAASLTPMFSGVRYEKIEGFKSLQWPVSQDGTDSPFLYEKSFAFPDGRARLFRVSYTQPLTTTKTYDLQLNNGRLLEHFHEGNETYKTEGIREKVPGTFVEISPTLATDRDISNSDLIKITSKWGSIIVPALVTERVSGNELYLPMNGQGERGINNLTGRIMDPTSHTPAYKELPVRIKKVNNGDGNSPLPKGNPRFYSANPQKGIMIENKWKRKDYVKLVTE